MGARLVLGCAIVCSLGCGSKQIAPVSGRVTLNNKPLANATVSFQPIAQKRSAEAGPGSTGRTDANGEFTLTLSTGEKGAWVGEHQVRISLLQTKDPEDDSRPERGGPPQEDQIPAEYNEKSKLTFTVPPEGTSKANFELKSP
jgi:hypothetical protein